MTERCPHCGVKIDTGGAKCGFCGAPLGVQGGEPPQFHPIVTLYNPGAFASLLLTPVFGSWCAWHDAKALGNKKIEQVALVAMPIFVVLGIVSALIFTLILPNINLKSRKGGGRGLIGMVNLLPWIGYYFVIHKPLADHIKKHDIICREKSCFLPALIAGVSFFAVVAAMFGIMCAANG